MPTESLKDVVKQIADTNITIEFDVAEFAFLGKHLSAYLDRAHPKIKAGLETGSLTSDDMVVHEVANLISIYHKLGEHTGILDEFNERFDRGV